MKVESVNLIHLRDKFLAIPISMGRFEAILLRITSALLNVSLLSGPEKTFKL